MYQARPTVYEGILMRSRLEAEFAASLDGLAAWEYEPRCFADASGQYLPDFHVYWTDLDHEYVEVKPPPRSAAEFIDHAKRMEIVLSSEPDARLVVTAPNEDVEFGADRFASGWRLFFTGREWRFRTPYESMRVVRNGRWKR